MDDCIYITDDETPQDEDIEIVKLVNSSSSKSDDCPVIIESIRPATTQRRHNHHHHHQHPPHRQPQNQSQIDIRSNRSQEPSTPPLSSSPPLVTIITPRPHPPPPAPAPPSSPSGPKCTICLTAFATRKQEGFKIIITKCGHLFCDICIVGSMKALGRRCPKCRRAIAVREKFIEVFDL